MIHRPRAFHSRSRANHIIPSLVLLASLLTSDPIRSEPTTPVDSARTYSIFTNQTLVSPGAVRITVQPELNRLPARDPDQIIRLLPGVNHDPRTGALHIHGAPPEDVLYYVDGIPQQDASTGKPAVNTPYRGVQCVGLQTGVWNAESGPASAGIVNIQTEAGLPRFHGSVEGISDDWHDDVLGYNLLGLALSGPLYPGTDRLSFAGAFERSGIGDPEEMDGALGPEVGNRFELQSWRGNIRWRLSADTEVGIGSMGHFYQGRIYDHTYYFNVAHMPRLSDENSTWWAGFSHRLSSRVSYTAKVYRQQSDFKQGDGLHFDDLLAYARPNHNPQSDASSMFWRWDNDLLDPDSVAVGTYVPLVTPVEFGVDSLTLPDGSTREVTYIASGDEGHVHEDFQRRKTGTTGVKLDFTGRVGDSHEVGLGGELRRYTLRRFQSLFPHSVLSQDSPEIPAEGFRWTERLGIDEFAEREKDDKYRGAHRPVEIGAWVQDRFALSDLRVLVGVRLDHFDYRTQWIPNPYPTYWNSTWLLDTLLESAPTHTVWSPRVGAELIITPSTSVHISHGIYHRRQPWVLVATDYRFFYRANESLDGTYVHANPALEPVRTKRTEAGVSHNFEHHGITLAATGFHAKTTNLATPILGRSAYQEYSTWSDERITNAEGITVQAEIRRTTGLAASAAYTFTDVKSTYPGWRAGYPVVWQNQTTPHFKDIPVYYDQPSVFTAILDYRLGDGEGPVIGGIRPVENSGINFVVRAASGYPYTLVSVYNEASIPPQGPFDPTVPVNSRRVESTYRADLKADRAFEISGTTLSLYLWILNLLDRRNAIDVWLSSGQAHTTGWANTSDGQVWIEQNQTIADASLLTGEQKLLLRENDPQHYDTGRQIRFGARLSF